MNKNYSLIFKKPRLAVLEESPFLEPGENEVLIETKSSMISIGTEMTIFNGESSGGEVWTRISQYPFVTGYSNVGKVLKAGAEADKSLIGRRVVSAGTHSKYVAAAADKVVVVPENVYDEEAVFFAISRIVMNSVRRSLAGWGDTTAVYGLGLLGQFVVRYCRLCGARPVFCIDTSDFRLGLLPDDPAIVKINPLHDDTCEIIRQRTNGRMADIVFEVTGNHELIPDEIKVLRKQGKFIVLGSPKGKTLFDFHDLCNYPSITIIGTHAASHPPFESLDNTWTIKHNTEFFFDLLADKELDISNLVSRRVNFREAPAIYEQLNFDRSHSMGIVIDWTE